MSYHKKVKILHINDRLNWSGGSQTYLIQLIEELEKRNVENIVIYGEQTYDIESNILSYYIPNITDFSFFGNKIKIKQLEKIVADEKPNIIYLHDINNLQVIEYCSRILTTFIFMHDYRFICPGNTKYFIRQERICEKNLGVQCLFYPYLKMCNNRRPDRVLKSFYKVLKAKNSLKNVHIIVASNYVKERLIEKKFKANQISVIPYFTKIPQSVGRNNRSKMILYLGRTAEAKGVNHLLKALALVKSDCETIITGAGNNLNNLKELSESLHIDSKVKFVGWADREHRDELLEECIFVVMPSLWPECFGIVGIEAMAFGKPVIAYNVGGVSDWLKDGENGLLVPQGNIKELAEKIEFLLRNSDIALDFGMKGKEIVRENFTDEKHIEKLLMIFKEKI